MVRVEEEAGRAVTGWPMEVPGEKLAIRIWETVTEKGIGGLLAPGHKRRMGRVEIALERDRRLALAQAEQEIKAIESGAKRLEGHRLVDVPPAGRSAVAPTHAEAVQRHVLADQMRREVNVARAVLRAEAAAVEEGEPAEGKPPPDREVDDDWFYRWRDSASTVSKRELQDLWGRVLAGEVQSPGTFSLRTLEFLKNLSQEEAQLIARLAPLVIDAGFGDSFVHRVVEPFGIRDSNLISLDDLGVIDFSFTTITSVTLRIPLTGRALTSHDYLLIARPRGAEDAELKLPCYRLTPVGRQVIKLGSFTAHEGYLRGVGEVIKEMGFKVELARVRSTEPGGVRCSDAGKL